MTEIFFARPLKPYQEHTSYLCKKFSLNVKRFDTVKEMLIALMSSTKPVEYAVIDSADIKSMMGTDIYAGINTLSTILKTNNPQAKIVVVVTKIIATDYLKTLISLDDIDFFTAGPGFSQSDKESTIENFLNQGERVPPLIKRLLVAKKRSARREIALTPRQRQILDIIITRGASNKVIAKMLSISESTVKLHVGCIFRKYHVKSRTQLAVFAKTTD